MLDAVAAAGIDELRHRVVDRLLGQAGKIEGDHIGQLAQFQRAGLCFQSQCAGAIQGGHTQGAVSVQGSGGAGDGLGQQGGGTGFAEQVEVVVAGGAIGADGDVDAGLPQAFDRAEAAGQFEVGLGAMHDAAVVLHQQCQVLVIDLRHVHRLEARAEQAEASQARQRTFAVLGDGFGHFLRGFVHMHMNAGIQLVSQYANLFQLVVADRVRRVGAESDANSRVLLEVIEQLQARTQRFGSVECAGYREVQYRDGDLRAHAGVVHTFGGGLRVEVHV